MKSYSDKLKDPRWQKKRLEILSRDEFTCKNCGNQKETLHIHHLHYVGENPWDCPNSFLMTLCASCHEKETKERKEAEEILLEQLRCKGFLSDGLLIIANAINKIELYLGHPSILDSKVISFALSSEKYSEIFCEYMDTKYSVK